MKKDNDYLVSIRNIVNAVGADATRKVVFFGTAFGQRLLRQAYFYIKNCREFNVKDFTTALTMDRVQKTIWPEVANYFLSGMAKYLEAENAWKLEPDQNKRVFWESFFELQESLGKQISRDSIRVDYLHKPDKRDHKPQNQSDIKRDLLNRRACKHLMTEDCFIFYALDEIDSRIAATGGYVQVNTKTDTKRKVPVASTELRFLFRNWDRFRSRTYFFRDLIPVSPPWEKDEVCFKDWAKYALHLSRKILLSTGRINFDLLMCVEKMLRCYCNEDYRNTIKYFHSFEPSRFLSQQLQHASTVRETLSEKCIDIIREIERVLVRGLEAPQPAKSFAL